MYRVPNAFPESNSMIFPWFSMTLASFSMIDMPEQWLILTLIYFHDFCLFFKFHDFSRSGKWIFHFPGFPWFSRPLGTLMYLVLWKHFYCTGEEDHEGDKTKSTPLREEPNNLSRNTTYSWKGGPKKLSARCTKAFPVPSLINFLESKSESNCIGSKSNQNSLVSLFESKLLF